MINNDTIQFIARVFAVAIAVAVLGIILIDALCIFHFGDGEAIKLIGQLNGPLVSAFGALGAATVGHQVLATILTHIFGTSTSPVPAGSPASALVPTASAQKAEAAA